MSRSPHATPSRKRKPAPATTATEPTEPQTLEEVLAAATADFEALLSDGVAHPTTMFASRVIELALTEAVKILQMTRWEGLPEPREFTTAHARLHAAVLKLRSTFEGMEPIAWPQTPGGRRMAHIVKPSAHEVAWSIAEVVHGLVLDEFCRLIPAAPNRRPGGEHRLDEFAVHHAVDAALERVHGEFPDIEHWPVRMIAADADQLRLLMRDELRPVTSGDSHSTTGTAPAEWLTFTDAAGRVKQSLESAGVRRNTFESLKGQISRACNQGYGPKQTNGLKRILEHVGVGLDRRISPDAVEAFALYKRDQANLYDG